MKLSTNQALALVAVALLAFYMGKKRAAVAAKSGQETVAVDPASSWLYAGQWAAT